MAVLDDSVHKAVVAHCAIGDELATEQRYAEALESFRAARDLLPPPQSEWEAALWVAGAIGDVAFLMGDYRLGRDTLMDAMKSLAGAAANSFLRLRLGQCLFELGELEAAQDWLAGAVAAEGIEFFESEDPKYLAFVLPKMKTPAGGW